MAVAGKGMLMPQTQFFAKVSVVILTYNRARSDVIECIESVKAMNYPNLEIILVDNSTRTPSKYNLLYPEVRLVDATGSKNLGSSAGRNLGIKYCSGEYVFFVDDDVVLGRHCIEELVKIAGSDSSIGIIGPLMYRYDVPFEVWFYDTAFLGTTKGGVIDVRMVVGGAMLVKQEVLQRIGGFDDLYFFYAEDWDYSYRAQVAGYRTVCALHAYSWHKVSSDEYAKLFAPHRAYYLHRNFFVFAARHRTTINGVANFLLKNLLYYGPGSVPSYFVFSSIRQRKLSALKSYVHGIFDGLAVFAKLTGANKAYALKAKQ